jgi:hypothetical protein
MSSCLYSLRKVLILTTKWIEKKVQWKSSALPLLPRRAAWFYHLHDNCLLVRSCHPNSSLPSPSQIMQEMLDKIFFCSNPTNSSFALFFLRAQPGFVSAPPRLQFRLLSWSPETHRKEQSTAQNPNEIQNQKAHTHTLLYTDGHTSKAKASKNKTPARGAATASNDSKKRARRCQPG